MLANYFSRCTNLPLLEFYWFYLNINIIMKLHSTSFKTQENTTPTTHSKVFIRLITAHTDTYSTNVIGWFY